MNSVVLGAGAVGGYFGGRLAESGQPVTFLVREKRYKQLSENGLTIKSVHGNITIHPRIAMNAKDIDHPDLVIIALKNYHLEAAMPALEILVKKGAKLLPLLNGVHHMDLLVERFGKENVFGGLCYIESTLNEKGHVVQTSKMQDIVFGALTKYNDHFSNEIQTVLERAKIHVLKTEAILEEMWKKYIFLASLSGVTSAVRQPIGVILNDNVTSQFLRDMITEVYEIAKARGMNLPDGTVNQVIQKVQSLNPEMTASMHRDLEKGLPLELESLHGALLKMASTYRVDTPSIKSIYALLHPYRNGVFN